MLVDAMRLLLVVGRAGDDSSRRRDRQSLFLCLSSAVAREAAASLCVTSTKKAHCPPGHGEYGGVLTMPMEPWGAPLVRASTYKKAAGTIPACSLHQRWPSVYVYWTPTTWFSPAEMPGQTCKCTGQLCELTDTSREAASVPRWQEHVVMP